MLGDLGAEVIKVEAPGAGDDFRHYRPSGWTSDGPGFVGLNRNKKSIEIDIKTAAGQQLCRELAERADCLVENFRPDVMERHGLHYQALAKVNPRLIYVSISGYGHTGPNRLVAGYDPIAQAESGLMYLTGDPAGEAQKAGGSVGDTITSLHAGMAMMAALQARHRTGKGQFVDVSLFDSLVSVIGYTTCFGLLTGDPVPRMGNRSFVVVPMGVFECADGAIMLVAGNDRQFTQLCNDALERPDLTVDPRYGSLATRLANRDALEATLSEVFATRRQGEWVERLRKAGVPAGCVRDPVAAARSAEARSRGLIKEVQIDGRSEQVVHSPFNLSDTPVRPPDAVPTLGEHSEQVLREVLGYDDKGIAALREGGAFGSAKP
jgi:crotonobetainyl-CoA:carnitine CoA-transferase CaiB-like acyl-CoA transferase